MRSASSTRIRELNERPDFRRSEANDDVFFGDAGAEQLQSDSRFRVVALDPHFSVDQINVNEAAVNPFVSDPSNGHHQIAITNSVEDRFLVDVVVDVRRLRVLGETAFNNVSITI